MADLRCYLTKAGIAAENNAKQFGSTLKITEMVFDGSYLADEENPENLTEVINPVLTVPCSTTISDDEQTLTFKGSILVEQGGFNVWGIGLKTDSGVLYGYARSKGDKILTEDEGATESVRYAVDIITKNSEVVEINVNPSTVYADLEDVDNAVKAGIEEHEAKEDPHDQYLRKDAKATLTSNDGVGNANLVFNHISGVPDSDGSAGRLNVGTDINDAAAWFGLASNVKAGVAVELTKIFTATLTDFDVKVGLKENGQRVFSPNNRNISDAITATSSTVYASQKAVKSVNDKFTNLFVGTKGTNGYQKLPNGLIIQWGFGATDATGKAKANFAVAFPNACLSVVATHKGSGPCNVISNEITKTYVTFILSNLPDLAGNSGWWAYYVAIGY